VNAFLFTALLATASSSGAVSLEALITGKSDFPALTDVQAAAANRVPDARKLSWAKRARISALLPSVDVSFGTDSDQGVRSSSRTGTSFSVEGREYGLKIRARWHLSEIVFDHAELRAYRDELASESARRLRADEVTQLYFNRVELFFLPLTPHRKIKAVRLEGRMHNLTGGAFFGGKNDP